MKKPEQRGQTGPSPGYLLELRQKGPLCQQVFRNSKAKKLVLVSATFVSVTGASKEAPEVVIDRVPYIHHPVQCQKDKEGATI